MSELFNEVQALVKERDALRAQLAAERERHEESNENYMQLLKEASTERDALRAELAAERAYRQGNLRLVEILEADLAKRDELLREARAWIVEGKVDFDDALADRIDATLNGV